MFENIKSDFNRRCQVDFGISAENCNNKTKIWYSGYGLQALASQRFYRWCCQKDNIFAMSLRLPFIPIGFIVSKIVGQLYDIKISSKATIMPGCYIGHFGGIRIGRCKIGKLCNINHQVTIGNFHSVGCDKETTIGERVWIGAHSKILSGVHIGTGATISAGTTVSSDVPEHALVAGPQARIINSNYNNTALLGLKIDAPR